MNFFQIIYNIFSAFIKNFHFYDEIHEPETKPDVEQETTTVVDDDDDEYYDVVDYEDEDEDDEDYEDEDDEDSEDEDEDDEDYETEDYETEDSEDEDYETEDSEDEDYETEDYETEDYETEDYETEDSEDEDYETEDSEDEDYETEDSEEEEDEEETTPVVEPEPLNKFFYITPDTEEEIFKNKRFLGRLTWAKIVRSYVLQNEITTFETTEISMNSLKRNVAKIFKPKFPVKKYNTSNQESIKEMTRYVFSKENAKLYIILKDINDKLFCIKISD